MLTVNNKVLEVCLKLTVATANCVFVFATLLVFQCTRFLVTVVLLTLVTVCLLGQQY